MHHGVCLTLASALFFVSVSARGDVAGADAASARALFDDARRLMEQNHYEEACPKLEQASRIDPEANGVRYRLATCYERIGRLASAWGLYSEVASRERLAGRMDRHELAKASADALGPRVPHLRIVVPSPTPGLQVRRDGGVVEAPLIDSEMPVDPGPHVVSATAPEREGWSERLVVEEASSYEVRVPLLTLAHPDRPSPEPPPRPREGRPPAVRAAILTAGIVGAGAVVAGAVFGVRALVLANDASGHCPTGGCDERGFSERSDSLTAGNVSTALLVGGGIVLAACTVLWFIEGSR